MLNTYRNWQLHLADDGILNVGLDKADASTNTLNVAIFEELAQIINDVSAQPQIKGLIFYSLKSTGFIAGADIEQFTALTTVDAAFDLIRRGQRLYDQLAALPIPTVALIDGFCLGGGLELALACRYRVAEDSTKTRLGLPEVMIGIHPGWGGSVRLPALIGAPQAMDLILSGRSVTAKAAKHMGLVDAVVPRRQLKIAAHHYATQTRPRPAPAWWVRHSNDAWLRPALAQLFRHKLRKKIQATQYPAPFAVIDNWQRHGVTGEAAYLAEANSLAQLQAQPSAKNCVRVFFLQNDLKALAKSAAGQHLRHVHVVGAGTMGGDIAMWCALKGYHVTLQDQTPASIAPAIKRAFQLFKAKLKKPLLIQAAMDRLQADVNGVGIATADVIIEAIYENAEAKRALFKVLEQTAKPTALLATNTSSIPLEEINTALAQPQRLVGIHFFNPVAKMLLVEVVHGVQTDARVLEAALGFVRKIDKLPLPVKGSPGFLVNRVLMPYLMECMSLLAEGHSAEAIDQAAVQFGMPMGPVELADSVGLDICLSVAKNLTAHFGGTVPPRLLALVEAKHLGRKTGQGFYHYQHDKAIKAKVPLDAVLEKQITTRLIFRLLNEAMACVREGVVANSDLLDAGMIFATGFAPFRGGPLHYAQQLGEKAVLETFQELWVTQGPRFKADVAWPDFFAASSTVVAPRESL